MKRISLNLFCTVVWKGVCQALTWFFSLFGYKRNGKFAKCVWGLFATSAAIIVAIIAVLLLYTVGLHAYKHYAYSKGICNDPYCYGDIRISRDIYYHSHGDDSGYIYNVNTGDKLIKHVAWIAKPMGRDSLVCFCNGKKRGYFSKYTGRVIVEPKYKHAWISSEGLAAVEENGYIKFLNQKGQVVIDKKLVFNPDIEGYVFHDNYCVVNTDQENSYGLMDKSGNLAIPMEYTYIRISNDYKLRALVKGEDMCVVDSNLDTILPMQECNVTFIDGAIEVIMPDHTVRKYDAKGNLIHDFYIYSIESLEYKTDDLGYTATMIDSESSEPFDAEVTPYHLSATARLWAYTAGDYYEGLMTKDGHIVTMPLYQEIVAIGPDLYLCTTPNDDKLVVNGKGEIVR